MFFTFYRKVTGHARVQQDSIRRRHHRLTVSKWCIHCVQGAPREHRPGTVSLMHSGKRIAVMRYKSVIIILLLNLLS